MPAIALKGALSLPLVAALALAPPAGGTGATHGTAPSAAQEAPGRQARHCPVVDVMTVYTPKAAAAVGGVHQVHASAQEIATRMNRSLLASDVCDSIRIVHPYTAEGYEGSDEFDAAYDGLREGDDPALGATARQRRDRYGADLVTLVVDASGRGGGTGDYTPDLTAASDAYAYAVVDVQGIALDSASHEIGHNLGLAHDRTTVADGSEGAMEVSSTRPYNTGWVTEDGAYYTIMAYRSSCGEHCRRVSRFSSAEGTWKGRRLGDAANDSARVLRETMPIVAGYRTAP
ncbi:M12 family metallo-peptidase [Streptomyces sp. NBC_00102]|uniref:M12 family metallo-peptidase n=1 Tax=Streptomyces sp. NBC_00102 TaxID=2975652 RepID=UPI00224F3ED3|nr:M12 family metallo-peptidase [Streptomyces sp. NBC_00102]MCX5401466.1 zinc-dependent metalloprotease [Streptomyces sp. NBC_00102]